tara:strand:- start:377 stop:823 length:447 start_codon:yes stop_codon:yes gene_type:complete
MGCVSQNKKGTKEEKIMEIVFENWRQYLKESNSLLLKIAGHPLNVEVASDERSITKGLMFRDKLNKNSGMLFVFSKPTQKSFFMKNTKIPLSIAYLDESGKILNIEDMTPYSTKGVTSDGKAKYAVEVNQGWFDSKGIIPGDRVEGIK